MKSIYSPVFYKHLCLIIHSVNGGNKHVAILIFSFILLVVFRKCSYSTELQCTYYKIHSQCLKRKSFSVICQSLYCRKLRSTSHDVIGAKRKNLTSLQSLRDSPLFSGDSMSTNLLFMLHNVPYPLFLHKIDFHFCFTRSVTGVLDVSLILCIIF